MVIIFAKFDLILIKKKISYEFVHENRSETSFISSYSIRMPCIEPHCNIECIDLFEGITKDGIINGSSLSSIQNEHLMIDMNNDELVNNLINSIPPPKICPYRQYTNSSPTIYSNISINFYPIIFGSPDQYLLETLSRKVLLNKKIYQINQICLPKKFQDFSELIPGRRETYKFKFESEIDYRRIYGASYFAITMKKGGWDCNRHYEIISTGTIPYFDKLNQAGNYTLSHLPKSLLYDAQNIQGVNRSHMTINHEVFDKDKYYLILHRLLYYAKHRLTTVKIVEYILNVIQYPLKSSSNHSVLYFSHYSDDYMKEYMLHGFTKIFKDNLHVSQPPKYLYDYPGSKMWNAEESNKYYQHDLSGFGFGFRLTLKNYFHLYQRDLKDLSNEDVLKNNIKNRIYSLIVFGSILRRNDLFPFVKNYYNRSQIILIDGEDEHTRDNRRSEYAKDAFYFLREIPDDCNRFL